MHHYQFLRNDCQNLELELLPVPWSISNDTATVIPLSNSPPPARYTEFPILKFLPRPSSAVPVMFATPMLAEPVAVSSPANADVTTSEPANAVKPIFFKVIHIFPFLFVCLFVINNKQEFYTEI